MRLPTVLAALAGSLALAAPPAEQHAQVDRRDSLTPPTKAAQPLPKGTMKPVVQHNKASPTEKHATLESAFLGPRPTGQGVLVWCKPDGDPNTAMCLPPNGYCNQGKYMIQLDTNPPHGTYCNEKCRCVPQ
ncbi:alcohol oxidase [Purpureocillium lavendulum]|uniref:Alcohol oxidase n=1 Tax=Purpureocillium lavendulum TaxID=1247861 RepID=A0AB34G1C8_9HYPO|nr:alcohol oxidase [Purpureocillium lavendulum]